MDIFSHGLWTNAVFEVAAQAKLKKRKTLKIWLAIFFGIMPDLFSFGVFFVVSIFQKFSVIFNYASSRFIEEATKALSKIIDIFPSTTESVGHISERLNTIIPSGPPDPSSIPSYVYTLYNFTHSLLFFFLIFGLVWFFRKKPYWLLVGWGFHIFIDIFSHTEKFFPTPFLFPISNFHVSLTSWGNPLFMIINYSALIGVYLWLYGFSSRRKLIKKSAKSKKN